MVGSWVLPPWQWLASFFWRFGFEKGTHFFVIYYIYFQSSVKFGEGTDVGETYQELQCFNGLVATGMWSNSRHQNSIGTIMSLSTSQQGKHSGNMIRMYPKMHCFCVFFCVSMKILNHVTWNVTIEVCIHGISGIPLFWCKDSTYVFLNFTGCFVTCWDARPGFQWQVKVYVDPLRKSLKIPISLVATVTMCSTRTCLDICIQTFSSLKLHSA